MTLTSQIKSLAIGKSISLTNVRVEIRPNGITHIFDLGSKMWANVNMQGRIVGGSLPLTKAQIRELTGMQV